MALSLRSLAAICSAFSPTGGNCEPEHAGWHAGSLRGDLDDYPQRSLPLNLPSTNIAAAASSTLDFGKVATAASLGSLSLASSLTVQDVAANGGIVQFGGDVTASANAAVMLSAGTGGLPSLVLAGTSNIQNIYAANSTTLTLPALAISANAVNVGNASGYNGSVVFSGSTVLSGASAPTVNVNAGTLKVSSTLSGAAGGNVQVNSGTCSAAASRPPSRSR